MPDPDKLYQDAVNAIQGVQTPDASSMSITLQNMVQQGIITPEQLQTALVDKNAFNNITQSPEFMQAQQSALQQLQQVGSEGGLTATDKAQLQDVTNQQNITNRGQEQAIMQNAQERGIGGSGLEMAARLQGQQSAADRASEQGTNVAAMAEQRALAAMQGAGQLGGQMGAQEFSQGAQKAQAQNAIDAANAAMMNQGNLYNTQTANAAQAQNLGEKQRISEGNVGLANTQEQYNKALPEQVFQNNLAKAQGEANAYSNWASSAKAKQAAKTGFNNQLLAGGLQAGGTALGTMAGGPVGGAVGGQVAGKFNSNAPQYENQLPGYNCGGMVEKNYKDGGMVPGNAMVPGDSPMNDTVHAKLSPGEVVVPRSLVSDFTKHSKPKGKPKVDHHDIAQVFKALASMKGEK